MPPTNSQKFRVFIQETRKAVDEYRHRQQALDAAFNRYPPYLMVGDQPMHTSHAPSSPSSPSSPPPPASGFGVNGIVTTDFGFGSANGNSLTLQPDGKIIAVGTSKNSEGVNSFALARYNPDGSIDSTFGSGGMVISNLDGGSDEAFDVVIRPDGKILVVGSSYTDNYSFLLACYTATGILDTGFGTGGYVLTRFNPDDGANGRAIALQPDGKIVVGGCVNVPLVFGLARYTPIGELDGSFDTDGMVTTNFRSNDDEAFDVSIQPDGKIVAAGFAESNGGTRAFAVALYNSDGSPDDGFNGWSAGKAITFIPNLNGTAYAVLLQPDGKIIAVGYSETSGNDCFALARYNPDGSLDTGFGVNGRVIIGIGEGDSKGQDAAFQSDGKIVVVGLGQGDEGQLPTVARYNTDGSLDMSFGVDGFTQFEFGQYSDVTAVLIQPDDKIIVGGSTFIATSYCFGMARLNADGSPDI